MFRFHPHEVNKQHIKSSAAVSFLLIEFSDPVVFSSLSPNCSRDAARRINWLETVSTDTPVRVEATGEAVSHTSGPQRDRTLWC